MKFDELFEHRSLVASKLKDCIRDMGYTKVSFAAKAGISRPTLDKLLNGSISNKSSFDRHLQKILQLLNMTVEELMSYHSLPSKPATEISIGTLFPASIRALTAPIAKLSEIAKIAVQSTPSSKSALVMRYPLSIE